MLRILGRHVGLLLAAGVLLQPAMAATPTLGRPLANPNQAKSAGELKPSSAPLGHAPVEVEIKAHYHADGSVSHECDGGHEDAASGDLAGTTPAEPSP